jgi:hypothetical protein
MGSRALLFVLGAAAVGCAHTDPRVFTLRDPVLRDQDLDPITVDCRKDPKGLSCTPDDYESSFAWDAADNILFRPISKFFAAEHVGEAKNVNAFDEVADSSWFVNRIGVRDMTPEEAAAGFCPEGPVLTSDPPDKAWLIDYGKDNGANPGFRVNMNGTKFMFKLDDEQIERATAATAIASRLYYAAGWWAPCDAVVYFRKTALGMKPGLKVKANVGPAVPFDAARLDNILAKTGRRGDLYRATASRFVVGKPIGPFTYEGLRPDDPNDVIPHEDRRDLRGARLLAAWTNHFDSREQNSMSTWVAVDPKDPKSPGHVRHWYIDLGDCFGSEWTIDGISKRHGYSGMADIGQMAEDWVTLGIPERPWDRAKRTPGAEVFGYFRSYDFEPDEWTGEYPNPAFGRATEHDNAWATRIIARFTPDHIAAAIKVGDFTNPNHTLFLTQMMIERRMKILQRYFAKLSPITDATVANGQLCAVDLARRTETYPASAFRYAATVSRGTSERVAVPTNALSEGRLCVSLPSTKPDGGPADDAPERYVVVRISNGVSKASVALHLYDLGPKRGLKLVGLERPDP